MQYMSQPGLNRHMMIYTDFYEVPLAFWHDEATSPDSSSLIVSTTFHHYNKGQHVLCRKATTGLTLLALVSIFRNMHMHSEHIVGQDLLYLIKRTDQEFKAPFA
jgi:hypothetical protein